MTDSLLTVVQTFGLMALCTLLFSHVVKTVRHRLTRHIALGLVFGFGAGVAMLQPILTINGYQIDARDIFIGMAAAFSAPLSAIIAMVIAIFVRLSIGGEGVIAGVSFILLVGALSGVWGYATRGVAARTWRSWAVLTVLVSVPIFLAVPFFGLISLTGLGTRLATNLACVLVLGRAIEAEIRRARRERQLDREAGTDPLTGLPNRRFLLRHFNSLDEQDRGALALIMIDIDHFKAINDTHGHDVGDKVLKAIAQELEGLARAGDFVARIGGEEFAVLIRTDRPDAAFGTAERLRNALSKTYTIGSKTLAITASAGATLLDPRFPSFEAVYKIADEALYRAKRGGRNQIAFA